MGQLVVECDQCLGRGSCGECYAPIRLLPFLLLLLYTPAPPLNN